MPATREKCVNPADDVDLNERLNQREDFYNFNRPHGAFKGKTPYEMLSCHLIVDRQRKVQK